MKDKAIDVDHYRKLVALHRKNFDPLVMIRVEDLAAMILAVDAMLDLTTDKPRVRRKAEGAPA